MIKRYIPALLLLTSFWFTSCDPNNEDPIDTFAPAIEIEDPENGEMFAAGSNIPAHIKFKDEVSLASANISVHSASDGHGHARVMTSPFSFNKNYSFGGREYEIREDIQIYGNATAGPYHFIVMAIDGLGNATSFANGTNKEVEIWITHPDMAKVVFENKEGQTVNHYHGEAGKLLNFYGTVKANSTKIESITVKISTHEDGGHQHRISTETFFEKSFTYSTPIESITIEKLLEKENIIITNDMIQQAGEEEIELEIMVKDQAGHIARHVTEITFGNHDH